jgi:hypothetical protein
MFGEIDTLEDNAFGVQEVEFNRVVARDLYRAGFGNSNLLARWDRIKTEVKFEDVVEQVLGFTDPVIRCPFHGGKSFTLYRRTNDAYCYGCPPGSGYYDSVRLIAGLHGYTRAQAITWLEKQYDLPPLEGIDEDEDEDDDDDDTGVATLTYADLIEPYITLASSQFLQNPEPELARKYIEIFFDSLPEKNADLSSEEELKRAVPLACVLGSEIVEAIKQRKVGK